MIKSLYVKNYALLDDVQVNFEEGLNILTGETGAGKSILLDALNTVLGEKVKFDSLRDGTQKAVIEVIFSTEGSYDVQNLLKELDLDQDGFDLILRREIHKSGRTRSFVNDTPVSVAVLEQIGELLVDLHGQHEHQSLLKVNRHLKFLDHFGGLTEIVSDVEKQYHQFMELRKHLEALLHQANVSREKKEIFEFQIKEIEAVDPKEGEEEELTREENLLQNSERLYELSSEVYQKLYEEDGSAYDLLAQAAEYLVELKQVDDRLSNLSDECESAKIIVDEMAKVLQQYTSHIEFNPERLQEIRERLNLFSGLKKKYGGSIEEVLKYKDKLRKNLVDYENFDATIDQIRKDLENRRVALSKLCQKLSAGRQAKTRILEKMIVEYLVHLGMARAIFKVNMTQFPDDEGLIALNGKSYRATAKGMDEVEFFISVNPGSPPRPLINVASGGEISRIMLALKSVQAESDRLPVMIFDEIDSGVSGRIAQAVGRSLKMLSKAHQIICITHLPQIASMGDNHYTVEKIFEGEQTRTSIRKLSEKERAVAIAKLLGGEKISETHIKSAEQLIAEASGDN